MDLDERIGVHSIGLFSPYFSRIFFSSFTGEDLALACGFSHHGSFRYPGNFRVNDRNKIAHSRIICAMRLQFHSILFFLAVSFCLSTLPSPCTPLSLPSPPSRQMITCRKTVRSRPVTFLIRPSSV